MPRIYTYKKSAKHNTEQFTYKKGAKHNQELIVSGVKKKDRDISRI